MIYVLIFILFLLIVCFFGVIRNERVYQMRKNMIEKIDTLAHEDIEHGRAWQWRYEKYESVSYNDIFSRFWLPLEPENFYNNTSFLN